MNYDFPPDDDAHPMRILEQLWQTHEELFEIRDFEPKVAIIFENEERMQHGRVILGTCYMPTVQGQLRGLFEDLLEAKLGFYPDFLITLSRSYWDVASELERQILVFHEAMHMGQAVDRYGTPRFNTMTGEPIFAIRGHDLEEFCCVVKRYGAWKSDVAAFLHAAGEHRPA